MLANNQQTNSLSKTPQVCCQPMAYLFVVCIGFWSLGASEPFPTSVHTYTRGVDAVGFDPAAVTLSQGLSLQMRSHIQSQQKKPRLFGTYFSYGSEWLSPFVGLSFEHMLGTEQRHVDLGFASRLNDSLALGLGYGRVTRHSSNHPWAFVDASFVAEPSSFLAMSSGVRFFSKKHQDQEQRDPSTHIGLGLRPWFGKPGLTLAADTHFSKDTRVFKYARVLLDVGTHGVHGIVSYEPHLERVWLGLTLDVGHLQIRNVTHMHTQNGQFQDFAGSITLRSRPIRPSLDEVLSPGQKRIEIVLTDDLMPEGRGLLDPGPAISPLALQIEQLAKDTSVHTLVLHIGKLSVGLSSVEELRSAIVACKKAGKRVEAEVSFLDDKAYMVAAAADHIRMDSMGDLELNGFAITTYYYADFLSKLGLQFESIEVGNYKSAPDQLTRAFPRKEEMETQGMLVHRALRVFVTALVQDRGFEPSQVFALIDQGVFTATEALEKGLVDELAPKPDALEQMEPTRLQGVSFDSLESAKQTWGPLPAIRVIPITGTIVMNQGDDPLPGVKAVASDILNALEQAYWDENVKAVVLRINSGGGDAYASELIWRLVQRLQHVKPVVASIGDVAASGGYYAAVPAHAIFAEPSSITGSIGIFTLRFNMEKLLELTGIRAVTHKEGEHADWDEPSHKLRPQDREKIHHVLKTYYDGFLKRVALGRSMKTSEVEKIAQGRVYTGEQAMMLGLVDGMGGLAAAIKEACGRAGLDEEAEVMVQLPRKKLSIANLLEHLAGGPQMFQAWEGLWKQLHFFQKPLALMPMTVEVDP